MQWDLTRLALPAARRTWLHLGSPRPSEIEAKTRKNRCWKTTRFWDRFCKGSDIVFQGFLVGLLDPKSMQKATWRKTSETHFVLQKPIRNRCWLLQQAAKIEQKSVKNRMFFGTSILKGFWARFGRGLGSQNHWFSHFFRCFFEVIFEARFGSQKN